ncbi:ABC transporter ATP-binding protein [Flavitalea sp. BT771]|uniref:ABC transporter ATP-binding protein n=1 Tax=Flavitalea sp. BT771 TaxID=3063329 RepID=UPI0026E19BE1|nr:ABC transporter ATP-binding protein [Flavitalea sp. BT771]MDO6430765.1 ABC transporter ATP-binding protein [Flavitalea sp. BT771]MDV6219095.1 ABC transporter ATP-binding protein [Flavitalea sp. BT771]
MDFLHVLLGGVKFVQAKGRKLAVAGETGSGKTTLLKTIAGLAQPDKGEVLFEGRRVLGPAEQLIPGHPGIAYLSQQFELPQHLRVEQVLEYANELPVEDAKVLFRLCRIDHLMKRKTHQLSGGERQRIALAKLLIGSPRLLLLDEPFSNLDMIHKEILKFVIRDIGQRLDITCILVSHDPLDTLSWADEILIMREGRIVQQGAPQEVYLRPETEYVAALLGKYNLLVAGNGKQLFVRPEHFKVGKKAFPGALRGVIRSITFWGSFYEIEILQEAGSVLIARVVENDLAAGDAVFILPPWDGVWYLPVLDRGA